MLYDKHLWTKYKKFIIIKLQNVSYQSKYFRKLNVKDIDVRGQTYFDIPTLTLSLAGLKFTYRLVWENIHVAANYDLEGDVADLHVFGNGDVL